MTMIIVLEDDPRRSNQMRRVIADSTSTLDAVFFDDARELIRWLPRNIDAVHVASLDCDLDTTSARKSTDAGSGQDIADYLATVAPRFPIVIHSSNAMRAPAMHMTLALAGWPFVSLSPYTAAELWLADILQIVNEFQ